MATRGFAGDPHYRRSQSARAQCGARAQCQAAPEAAEAGFAAGAAGAMAHAGRGGIGGQQARQDVRDGPGASPNPEIGSAAVAPRQCSNSAACRHCSGSILEAMITAWVRLSTPSFCKIAETCAFTVASETPSA